MLARKALAGTAGAPKEYVEDVFSTYLYTGTGSNQTITNNIDLSGKGGAVWIKSRSNAYSHRIGDTERGATKRIIPNSSNAEDDTGTAGITAFTSSGFSIGDDAGLNQSSATYVSWTFRKAEKFFDIVTYSGNSVDDRAISHNLGSTPGCVIVRRLSGDDWFVYHRSLAANNGLRLNKTDSASSNTSTVKSVSSTTFTVGTDGMVNVSGSDYVAYLFAHDAGGFGDAGSDNVISCGSFTTNGSGVATVTLGYEPQWVLVKQTTGVRGWFMYDIMRGMFANGGAFELRADLSNSENDYSAYNNIAPTATGFVTGSGTFSASTTYIYIAIRRGPMKTPETGTSVFTPTAFSGNDTSGTRSAGLNAFDLLIAKRTNSALGWVWLDKLRSLAGDKWLTSNATTAEGGGDIINTINGQYTQDGINITKTSNYGYLDSNGDTYIWYALKRAPKFFDEICYTGTGSARTISHNLGVVPELMIVKRRDASASWAVYTSTLGNTGILFLDLTGTNSGPDTQWNSTTPTSSVFSLGSNTEVNANGGTFVAYLFASLSGISKIGSYSGNGSNQTINCGFTNGVRLVLIKSQSGATGDWVVFDSARGIVSGDDPYLRLNSTAAEVTNKDAVDTDNTGFVVNETTGPNVNTSGVTYLYLAIA